MDNTEPNTTVDETVLKDPGIESYEVPDKQFCTVEKRQYYGGYAFFDKETAEFMMSAKSDSIVYLDSMR